MSNDRLCKGDWRIGTACGECKRCIETAKTLIPELLKRDAALEALRVEFSKPQFMTQSSGGGEASVEFKFYGHDRLTRARSLHDAFAGIAKAIAPPVSADHGASTYIEGPCHTIPADEAVSDSDLRELLAKTLETSHPDLANGVRRFDKCMIPSMAVILFGRKITAAIKARGAESPVVSDEADAQVMEGIVRRIRASDPNREERMRLAKAVTNHLDSPMADTNGLMRKIGMLCDFIEGEE